MMLTISLNDIIKPVRKERFDIKWNTVLAINNDDELNKSTDELMDYFSSNDDDAKIFLIVNNEEIGYLSSEDYLLTIQKSLDKESKGLGGDIVLPGESNITIGSGNIINYVCPVNDCYYKINRLDLQNPRYMCKKHKGKKLVKEQI